MKIFGIIVIVFVVITVFSSCGTYNGMVGKQEAVEGQWGNVENVYQRRADLIPNLVQVVKGYATHERETLEAVIAARASATQVKLDPSNMTPENLQQFQAAQDQLGSTLARLMVVVENYPELKANQGFLDLQAQLEGTENRIAVERRRFNETAQDYNATIRRFPATIIAGMTGFEKKAYFEAAEGSNTAPQVQFDF